MATAKRPRTTKSNTKASNTPEATVGAAKAEVAKVTTQAVDMQDVIRARAYELYQQRGGDHGRDTEDWLRAEAEVLSRFGARTA